MLYWLLQNTFIAAVLAAGVLAVCRTRRIGPAGRHLLWLVVLVKLVTPPLVVWPWPAPRWNERFAAASATSPPQRLPRADRNPAGEAAANGGDGTVVRSETFVVTLPAKKRGTTDPAETSAAVPAQESAPDAESVRVAEPLLPTPPWWRQLSVTFWLLAGWGCGSVMYLLLQAIRIRRMSFRLRAAESPPVWLAAEIRRWAEQLHVTPPPSCVVPGVSSPFLWAFRRVRLIWPKELTTEADLDAWRGVIVHELAHLKRRDHWVGWLELVAGCVWWWNPLFWYVRNQIRENAELACDAWVVETLPGGRRQYAEALLTVCEHISRPVVPVAAFGVGGARRNLERRLTMILKDRVPFRVSRGLLCAAAVLALLILPGWAQPGNDADPASDDAQRTQGFQKPLGSGARGPVSPNDSSDSAPSPARRKSSARKAAAEKSAAGKALNDYDTPFSRSSAARRVRALEQQIQALQNQLRAINAKRTAMPATDPMIAEPRTTKNRLFGSQSADGASSNRLFGSQSADGASSKEVVATRTITLQRTTYRLPASRAKALEAFLKLHIKAEVLSIEIGTAPAARPRPGVLSGPMDPTGAPMPGGRGPIGSGKRPGVLPMSRLGGAGGPMPGAGGPEPLGPMGAGPMGVLPMMGPSTVPVITITTTPEVQKVIAGLIALMRKDELPTDGKKVGSGGYGYPSRPMGGVGGAPSPEGFDPAGSTGAKGVGGAPLPSGDPPAEGNPLKTGSNPAGFALPPGKKPPANPVKRQPE